MVFRIERGEVLAHAVKRLAHDQLANACQELANGPASVAHPSSGSVHDVRTAIRRTRALSRLVGPVVGQAAQRADHHLRAIARQLSAARDGEVLLATFERVRRSAGVRGGGKLSAAREMLQLRQRAGAIGNAGQRALRARLQRARRDVARWVPDDLRWPSLAPGLIEVYRRCRRRMRSAYARESSGAFHAWRRAVKDHRYHMQALAPQLPDELGARRDGLEQLGDLLGEEHDLALLAGALREEGACRGDDEGCRRLLAALEKRQRQLRAQARPLGERLFAEKPSRLERRLRAVFRTSFRAFGHEPRET